MEQVRGGAAPAQRGDSKSIEAPRPAPRHLRSRVGGGPGGRLPRGSRRQEGQHELPPVQGRRDSGRREKGGQASHRYRRRGQGCGVTTQRVREALQPEPWGVGSVLGCGPARALGEYEGLALPLAQQSGTFGDTPTGGGPPSLGAGLCWSLKFSNIVRKSPLYSPGRGFSVTSFEFTSL